MAETKVLDTAAPSTTSGKKKNHAKKQKTEHGNDDELISRVKIYLNLITVLKLNLELITL